jgi:arsenite methyltransferase
MAAGSRDRWAEWLAKRRFGGDPEVRRQVFPQLLVIRDRVLDRADLEDGEHLLDVGCGEGLIAFGALERGAGRATFSDNSTDLLALCRDAATELEVLERCEFVHAQAEDLAPIPDGSVDVVTTRSVLIYVKDKARAFGEFARVLPPGGRISLFEPINRFGRDPGRCTFLGYDLTGVEVIGQKLRAVFDALQPPDSDPMTDFDERDLVRLAEGAGFFPINLILDAVVEPLPPRDWDVFLNTAGNPNIPIVGEAMRSALTAAEQRHLTTHLRPLVEQGRGVWRMATASLVATKPHSE